MSRGQTVVELTLARYGAVVREALLDCLPSAEPQRYLYDLLLDYPLRGGKMLRSSLCIAVCRAFGGTLDEVLDSAVALEMLHNAFLIHDDIEDESVQRRGRPSLHQEHGTALALNAGDALSLLSMEPLARNCDVLGPGLAWEILRETYSVAQRTVEGQALELGWRQENAANLTAEDYLRMVLKKTGWYTAILPCRVGAMIGCRSAVHPSFAVAFGFYLGAVFQIRDDILNLVGSAGDHGKQPADDILEGKRTLMLIHLLQSLNEQGREKLLQILRLPRDERTPRQVSWILQQMDTQGSIEFARSCADELAQAALCEFDATFGALPPSEDKRFIEALVSYMTERER